MALIRGAAISLIMTTVYNPNTESRRLVRGIRLALNEATKSSIEAKAERLFRH